MRTVFIYALTSSRDAFEQVWYVGQSVDTFGRFEKHHVKDQGSRKATWIQRELAEGFTVRPRIVEECHAGNADEREIHWIEFFGRLNPDLTNGPAQRDSRAAYLATTLHRQREQLAADREWLTRMVNNGKA